MAEWKQSRLPGGNKAGKLKRALHSILPEWQVFVRRDNGRADQFTITRKGQLLALAGLCLLALWAGIVTTALTYRPQHLAAKERELEQMLAATRAAQHRLVAAEKLVAGITAEVDVVHTNLLTLAESSDTLTKEPAKPAAPRARPVAEPAAEDETLAGSAEVKAMRAQVRRLEDSLVRLRTAYTRAARHTAASAGSRIEKVEEQISKLGINTRQLVDTRRSPGQGGPFIPAYAAEEDRFAMGALIERVQQWNGVKAAMQRLPLAVPVRGEYSLNSGFGTRADPLNHRTATHEGLDFGAPIGTPVYATGEGEVTFAGRKDGYGNIVEVDHGNGITTRYAHMSRIKAHVGQKVNRASVVGLVGNSGRSTGAHLHYEVRLSDSPKDPIKFISVGRDAAKIR